MSLQSDNSPSFVSQIIQRIFKALEITYHLHTWLLQSSGKVEMANS
jgi:hypothetical protein